MIVHVMLGTKCNYNCKYCHQVKEESFEKDMLPDFGTRLCEWLTENNKQLTSIHYWGGEPCLYIDQIKAIHKQMTIPHNRRRFTTNGSLLTPEIVDFLNENKFSTVVSYHQGQLKPENWELIFRIKDLTITSLIHHYQLDWESYKRKWQDLCSYYGRYVTWHVYPVYNVDITAKYRMSISDADTFMHYIYSILPTLQSDLFNKMVVDGLLGYLDVYKPDSECLCFNADVLSIDLHGNQYTCHHGCGDAFKLGNIFKNEYKESIPQLRLKDECRVCEAYDVCKGGCFRESNNTSCYITKELLKLKKELSHEV